MESATLLEGWNHCWSKPFASTSSSRSMMIGELLTTKSWSIVLWILCISSKMMQERVQLTDEVVIALPWDGRLQYDYEGRAPLNLSINLAKLEIVFFGSSCRSVLFAWQQRYQVRGSFSESERSQWVHKNEGRCCCCLHTPTAKLLVIALIAIRE